MSNPHASFKHDLQSRASGSSAGKPQRGGYRTVLCRNLLTTGSCRYGDRCTFAHTDVPPPASMTNELDPFNPTNDDPVSPVYPIKRQLRKPSFDTGLPTPGSAQDRPRGRSFGYEPPFEGLFALGTGVLAGGERSAVTEEQDEAKRAKNPFYRTKPCKLYAQGVCAHGSACSFLHSDEQTPSISIRSPSASPSLGSASRAPISSSSKPLSPNRLLYKTSPCRFYSSVPGAPSCTKGEHCTFLHGEERTSWRDRAVKREKTVSASSGGGGGEEGVDEKHRLWRTEPCVYYQQGKCSRGDSCNYLHVAAQDNQAALGRKPCKIYAENGFCKWGTECRYVHQSSDNASPYDAGRPSSSRAGSAPTVPPVARMIRDVESDEEDDDFEVVLEQGSAGEPSPLLFGGQPMQHQQHPSQPMVAAQQNGGGDEQEEEFDASDVHNAFKHLSVAQ